MYAAGVVVLTIGSSNTVCHMPAVHFVRFACSNLSASGILELESRLEVTRCQVSSEFCTEWT